MPTFNVDSVEIGPAPEDSLITDIPGAILSSGKTKVEAWGAACETILKPRVNNGLVMAVHTAYSNHYHLTLSPEDIWLAIAQGFANHVNSNAETLRKLFVKHEGQKELMISRGNFIKGSAANDWPGCFNEFSGMIGEHLGDKQDLLVSNFSTTSSLERAVTNLVLMDAMQAYFSYGMTTACGIPSITLLGTLEDWVSIRTRAQSLAEYQCPNWIDILSLILDQFVKAYCGDVDKEFWSRIYKVSGGSGGPYINGWLVALFPYLVKSGAKTNIRKNDFISTCLDKPRMMCGLKTADFPVGLSRVPLTWYYHDTVYKMRLLGGFVGATFDAPTSMIRPVIGWGVGDDKNSK